MDRNEIMLMLKTIFRKRVSYFIALTLDPQEKQGAILLFTYKVSWVLHLILDIKNFLLRDSRH